MAKQKQDHSLTLWILSAIVLAIVAALVGPLVAIRFRAVEHLLPILHLGGEVFLNLLKMIVVPLVITSVMTGILGLGDIRKLGKPGAAAVGYYLCTTVLAVIVGLIVVNVMQPGVGAVDQERLDAIAAEHQADETIAGRETPSIGTILTNMVLMLFTDNLFKETVETNLLPLIIFSIIFAGVLTTMDAKVDTLKQIISQANDALMVFVLLLMRLAPLGIFCLVAARFWEAQAKGQFLDELKSIGDLRGDRTRRLGDSRLHHATSDLLDIHTAKSLRLRFPDGAGLVDRVFHSQLVGHATRDDGGSGRSRCFLASHGLCLAIRGHDQHGRHSAVRSGRRHFHCPSDRHAVRCGRDGDDCDNSDFGGHRSRWNSRSWFDNHADCLGSSWPAVGICRLDSARGLAAGSFPHGSQRLGRFRGRGGRRYNHPN